MPTELETELERTSRLRGFRYGVHDFEASVWGVEHLKKHNDRTEANYLKKSLLDRKAKEMAIIVACITHGDLISHLQIHFHAAQKAGATPEEILETIVLVGAWIGFLKQVMAMEAWRATFRPDLPTIDRVTDLR